LLCCEVRMVKSGHIYVGAEWMVGHSIRGKKTASDLEETHPSTRYTIWCSDSQTNTPYVFNIWSNSLKTLPTTSFTVRI
jgi:hypothetical protein